LILITHAGKERTVMKTESEKMDILIEKLEHRARGGYTTPGTIRDLCRDAARSLGQLQDELKQYKKLGTVEEMKNLTYLRERYENEAYDYCGEYGSDDCQFKDIIERHLRRRREGA